MKQGLHPKLNPVCFVDVSTGHKFFSRAALKAKKTETIDGVEYQLVVRDVTSDSHPAYTGEKRVVDSAGRVEKFQKKFARKRAKR